MEHSHEREVTDEEERVEFLRLPPGREGSTSIAIYQSKDGPVEIPYTAPYDPLSARQALRDDNSNVVEHHLGELTYYDQGQSGGYKQTWPLDMTWPDEPLTDAEGNVTESGRAARISASDLVATRIRDLESRGATSIRFRRNEDCEII